MYPDLPIHTPEGPTSASLAVPFESRFTHTPEAAGFVDADSVFVASGGAVSTFVDIYNIKLGTLLSELDCRQPDGI